MATNGGRIDFTVGFKGDTSGLNQVKSALEGLSKIKISDFKGARQDLNEVRRTALTVEEALEKAFNPKINSINVKTFNNELSKSGLNINSVYQQFSKAGSQGQVAFSKMTSSLLTTNLQLKETHSLLENMGTTMMNTIKWGIASSVMNNFTQSVQSAFSYVKSLEASLTDIRIVTGDSTARMEEFAQSANKAAQALGRSTMDYSKAALSFYQQGLSDEDVQTRTEATLKAQNITGAGSQMADYLTAVWNGYKVANEEAQLYVDKLAAVADSSASNMSQISVAMSKVAATANTLGVNVDQLAAQIATVVATTRMAPESVGTAFKTIYSRLNDIKTGAEGAETTLGNYSSKMAELGFNVLTASGELRDTGEVIEQIGGKWESLTREQQAYLASTLGGQRQITQVMALFDNWGKYTDLLNVSLEAQGTLAEKNSRYMESLGAKMEQLGAAGERAKAAMIDEGDMKGVVQLATAVTTLFANFIESIGGGTNALIGFGGIFTQLFSGVITKEIDSIVTNMQRVKSNAEIIKNDVMQTELMGRSQGYQEGTIKEMVDAKRQIHEYNALLSKDEYESYNEIVKNIGASKQQLLVLEDQIKAAQEFNAAITKASQQNGGKGDFNEQLIAASTALQQLQAEIQNVNTLNLFGDSAGNEASLEILKEAVEDFRSEVGDALPEAFAKVDAAMKAAEATSYSSNTAVREATRAVQELFNAGSGAMGASQNLEVLQIEANKAQAALDLAKKSADDFTNSLSQTSKIQNMVNTVGALGQVASALRTLSFDNLKGIWSNQNLSDSQKLLQTFTSIGSAVPMLVAGFQKLQTTTQGLSNAFLNQSAIQAAKAKIDAAEAAQAAASEKIKKAQALASTDAAAAKEMQAKATEELAIAEQQAKVAQDGLNAAMAANPIGAIVTGIIVAVTAITTLAKVIDAVTMSVEEAEEAIDNFNKKQQELTANSREYSKNVFDLQSAKKEWEELSTKAGAYNSTITNLTDEEKQRYYDLSNLIASYNSDAVTAYDQQGNAIIALNHNLDETIAKLKEKHQLEVDETYDSKEFKQAQKGESKLYTSKRDDTNASMQDITRMLDYQTNAGKIDIDTYDSIIQLIDELSESQDFTGEKGQELLTALNNLTTNLSSEDAESFKPLIEAYANDLSDLQDLAQANTSKLLNMLETSDNNELYNQAKEAGFTGIDSLITGYVQGLEESGEISREKLGNPENYQQAIIDMINGPDGVLQKINDAFIIKDNNGQIVGNIGDQLNERVNTFNEKLAAWINQDPTASLSDKLNAKHQHIQNFLNTEDAQLQALFDEAAKNDALAQALQNYLAQLYNVDNINIDFNNKEVKQVVDEKIKSGLQSIVQAITDATGETDLTAVDISARLDPNLTGPELDQIATKFKEIYGEVGNVDQALQQAEQEVLALGNASSNVTTINLAARQGAGESLKDEEVAQLSAGLQSLAQQYPLLAEQVEILSNQWLASTDAYQNALETVKTSVINSFGEMLAAGEISHQDYINKISSMVTNAENYQDVLRQGFLTQEEQANLLFQVASQYESCTNEINAYAQALLTGNEAAQQAALKNAQLSLYIAESAEAHEINADRLEGVAEQFRQFAEEGVEGYEGLNDQAGVNAQLVADAATRYILLNDAIEDLGQNFDNYKEILEEANQQGLDNVYASQAMSEAFQNIKDDVADILDVSGDLLDDDWIVDHMNDILDAAGGSQEAVRSLQEAMAEQVVMNLDIDWDNFNGTLASTQEEVADWANNLPEGELSVDDTVFLQQLVSAMQSAGMAQADIKNALSGLDIDVDLAPYEAGLNTAIDDAMHAGTLASDSFAANAGVSVNTSSSTDTAEDTRQQVEFDEAISFNPITRENSVLEEDATTPATVTTTYYEAHKNVTPRPVTQTATTETTATALQVVGANKKSGGKISHKNASGGNKKSSGGSGGKKKGGGGGKKKGGGGGGKKKGGSGSSAKTKDPAKMDEIKEQRDRYHDINNTITQIDTKLKQVSQKQKKLSGKDLIDNLNEQLQILKKQVQAYKVKLKLEKQQVQELRASLGAEGALFDANTGALTNYNSLLETKLAALNSVIAHYNGLSADEQTTYKDTVEAAKKEYEEFKKQMGRYDDLIFSDIPKQEELIRKALDQQIEIEVQKFKMRVQLELDLSEAERDWNKFKKTVLDQIRDDDVLGNVKAQFADFTSYYKDGLDVIDALADQVNGTLDQLKQIDQTGTANVYGDNRAKALEDLKNYIDELADNLEDVEDLINDIKESIFDAIDHVQDSIDDQVDEYDYITDLIDHNVKMVQLLYGQDAYATMQKYFSMQEKNNNKELNFLKQQKDMWYERMELEKARMSELDSGTNEWKEANDRLEEYKKHWMDALGEINDLLENSLENIIDKYSNAVDLIFDKLNDKLTHQKGLQHIDEQWQLINDYADIYLDKINSMYEINNLEDAYKQAIEDSKDNVRAQTALNSLMEQQLKYLRDKERLTQYDIDRANALLQIEIKRIALEQSQQSKSKLRLRRDSQGNYSYQYTADENAIREAEQGLAEAQNSLYNLTKEAYKQNLNNYFDATTEWQEKLGDVYKDTTLTAEEQQAEIAMINEYYGQIINGLTAENEELKQFMMEDTFNTLSALYEKDIEDYQNLSDTEKDILMNEMVPYWQSGIQTMADVFAGEGGFIPTVKDSMEELNNNTKDYQKSLEDLQAAAETDFNNINDAIDVTISQTEELLESNDELIDSYKQELTAVQNVIDSVEKLADKYKKAKEEAIAATKAAYDYWWQENKDTAEAAQNPMDKATGASGKNSTTNGTNGTDVNGAGANGSVTPAMIEGLAAAIWMDGHASGWGNNPVRSSRFIEKFDVATAKAVQDYINQHAGTGQIYKTWAGRRSELKKYWYSAFDTGGYTGSWGNNGRLGILHEKELVLNREDTENLLSAIDVTRRMSGLLNALNSSGAIAQLGSSSAGAVLGQDVRITAEFPNVTNHLEIEEAFNNLINRASQYAFSKR